MPGGRVKSRVVDGDAGVRMQALEMAIAASVPAERIVPLAFEIANFVTTGKVVSATEGVTGVDRPLLRVTPDADGSLQAGPAQPPALPTGRQLEVLQAVTRLECAGEKITMHTVAGVTTVDPQTANKHMNALVEAGWIEKRLNVARNRAHWHVLFPDAVPKPADSKPLATRDAIRLFCQAHDEWLTVEELRKSVNGDPSLPLVELVEAGKLQRRFVDGGLEYRAVRQAVAS